MDQSGKFQNSGNILTEAEAAALAREWQAVDEQAPPALRARLHREAQLREMTRQPRMIYPEQVMMAALWLTAMGGALWQLLG